MARRWSPDHLRLHRLLLRRPTLLPAEAPLLLAVSGGQDSMALLGLLQDLRRLHHWSLQLWHGDHGWRAESSRQAEELVEWAGLQGLRITVDRWETPGRDEGAARHWRYGRLCAQARAMGAIRVVSGHTASDRAETLLLQLARGSHRRGLTGPQALRPLAEGIQLARPLLAFSRDDTARIRQQLRLPLWPDPSNDDPSFSRNRIRRDVVPVLEALHPGASRRLSALSERLAEEEQARGELTELALGTLASSPQGETTRLDRRALARLQPANQRLLLQHWFQRHGVAALPSHQLDDLVRRLEPQRGPGRRDLGAGRQLRWEREQLWLAEAGELP